MVRVAIVLVVASLISLGLALGGGCNTATLTLAPDTGIFKDCVAGPRVFCDAGVLTGPSCTVTPNESDPRLASLTPEQYADGCIVNFIGSGHDINGDCLLNAVCKCQTPAQSSTSEGGAPPPPEWNCGPQLDATP